MKSSRVILGLAGASFLLIAVVALRIRTEQFNGTSPWFFLSAVAATSFLLVELALRATLSAASRARVRLLAITTVAMLFAAESALRYGTPRWATYTERNGGSFVRQYTGEPSWFRAYTEPGSLRFSTPEYTHYRDSNSLGLTGPEPIRDKAPGEFRILALGDSFTEGLGTSVETTWVKITEARLQDRYPQRRITSINAGMSGNDVYSELMTLKEKLLPFKPDLVILALNTSDMNEITVRGATERFQPDGTVKYRNGPRWEPIYGLSYIWRAIAHQVLGYNFLLIRSGDMPARDREAATLLRAGLMSIREVCRAHGTEFLVASHPHAYEIIQGSYGNPAYGTLMESLESERDFRFVDLLKYYTSHGLITKQTAQSFYWPLDLHHNTQGYRVMGEAIAAQVVEKRLGPKN